MKKLLLSLSILSSPIIASQTFTDQQNSAAAIENVIQNLRGIVGPFKIEEFRKNLTSEDTKTLNTVSEIVLKGKPFTLLTFITTENKNLTEALSFLIETNKYHKYNQKQQPRFIDSHNQSKWGFELADLKNNRASVEFNLAEGNFFGPTPFWTKKKIAFGLSTVGAASIGGYFLYKKLK